MTKTTNPDERKYEKPVAWLFGEQLIGRLKGALLYTAYGKKLDPRDWMTAEVFSFDDESTTEFWFDYLADAGDGTRAMYSIAYLAMSNLWSRLAPNTTVLPGTASGREVSTLQDEKEPFTFALPRGEFLFFGGDTAYHAAEYMTLFNRIQHPFNYAYLDLLNRKLIPENEPRRPVFGIPGNHDYYDQLDGFRRQFRRPVRPEAPLPPAKSAGKYAQLTIAGFERVQEASYVALRLPFDWWFWGLDTESPSDRPRQNLDRRQMDFFHELAKVNPPDKLILATCTPSTVFGRIAVEDEPKVSTPQKALKIGRPFLPDKTAPDPDLKTTGDAKLTEGQCRLDLSGDVHQYARYWGPEAPKVPSEPPIRNHNSAPAPTARSYASVVSGLGGAFHHPSTTYDNEICEQVLYPTEDKSREAFANRLFRFWNVISGGRVWVAGIIIAFTIYFGATVPPSSKQFLGNIRLLNHLNPTLPESINPTIISSKACDMVEPFWLWTTLGVVKDAWHPPADCKVDHPLYFFALPDSWPLDFFLGELFIGISLIAIIVTLFLSVFTGKIFNDHSPFETGAEPEKKLWSLIIGNALLVIIGMFSIKPYRDHITPFGSSLLVLFTIFAAITAIVLSVRYGEYRFQKSFVPNGGGNRWLEIACWLLAVAVVACGLWFFGKNNLPAFLISDILLVTIILLVLIATMLLPFIVAGDLLYTHSKPIQIIGKFLIGSWHLILQLLVTYILIRNGNFITWGVAAVLLLVLSFWPGPQLLKRNNRIGLALVWLGYGAVMLTWPWIIAVVLSRFHIGYVPLFSNTNGWMGLLPAVIAGGVGAIISCVWTGWYFAVAFAFNGHNNEVGGAARIENFKQFIRFRLTRNGLTGYVIAVDDVSKIDEVDASGHTFDGSDLKLKLIDVFHLVPK